MGVVFNAGFSTSRRGLVEESQVTSFEPIEMDIAA